MGDFYAKMVTHEKKVNIKTSKAHTQSVVRVCQKVARKLVALHEGGPPVEVIDDRSLLPTSNSAGLLQHAEKIEEPIDEGYQFGVGRHPLRRHQGVLGQFLLVPGVHVLYLADSLKQ